MSCIMTLSVEGEGFVSRGNSPIFEVVKVTAMKKLIFVLSIVLISVVTNYASTNPVESIRIIDNTSVEVSFVDKLDINLFTVATFHSDREIFEFQAEGEIQHIQIFNDAGVLKFQLPVLSSKVKISKKLFEQGNYKLGFLMDGESKVKFTNVVVK